MEPCCAVDGICFIHKGCLRIPGKELTQLSVTLFLFTQERLVRFDRQMFCLN